MGLRKSFFLAVPQHSARHRSGAEFRLYLWGFIDCLLIAVVADPSTLLWHARLKLRWKAVAGPESEFRIGLENF